MTRLLRAKGLYGLEHRCWVISWWYVIGWWFRHGHLLALWGYSVDGQRARRFDIIADGALTWHVIYYDATTTWMVRSCHRRKLKRQCHCYRLYLQSSQDHVSFRINCWWVRLAATRYQNVYDCAILRQMAYSFSQIGVNGMWDVINAYTKKDELIHRTAVGYERVMLEYHLPQFLRIV